jgi:hypothetical protein
MIISTPIDFPKIEPTDWNEWWRVWETEAKLVKKNSVTANTFSVKWLGFDVWVRPGCEKGSTFHYNFENINRPDLFPQIFADDFPIYVKHLRAACSLDDVPAHQDYRNSVISVRTMLYNNNPRSTWYYEIDDRKEYLKMPDTTNTWFYRDADCKHGTDFIPGHKKILLMPFGPLKPGFLEKIEADAEQKFKDYTLYR